MNVINVKECSWCHKIKDLSDFYKSNRNQSGLFSHCKLCHKVYTRAYQRTDKGKNISKRCRIKWQVTPKARECHRNTDFKKNYGITLGQYNELFAKQNGVCAICGKPET